MAELLVRVVDKVHADFYLNCACTKRGDVIAVQPDGWAWGTGELEHPEWRIIALPGVDPSDLSGLLAPELDVNPKHPSKTLQRRAFKLDLDHPAFVGVHGKSHKVRQRLNVAPDLITAITRMKSPIRDPKVIGAVKSVIG